MSKLEQAARELPKKADVDTPAELDKEMNAFVKEVNSIRDDKKRIGIAKNIDWNESHDKTNTALPKVDIVFDDKGRVDSIKRDTKDAKKETFYDDAGKKIKEVEVDKSDTRTKEFDPATGKKIKDTLTWGKNASSVETYDPHTGKMTSEETHWDNGSSKLVKYDAKTGNVLESHHKDSAGNTTDYEYSYAGKVQRKLEVGKEQTTETFFDPVTGNRLASQVTRKDKSVEFTKYDPVTGDPISIDKKDKDGKITNWKK